MLILDIAMQQDFKIYLEKLKGKVFKNFCKDLLNNLTPDNCKLYTRIQNSIMQAQLSWCLQLSKDMITNQFTTGN